jgi:hypothetical protein
MLNENKNGNKEVRVLSRMGARQLTSEEAGQIGGGTFLSTLRTGGGADTWLDQ